MKTIKYILVYMLCFASLTSCIVDDEEPSTANGTGPNLGGFNDASLNFGGVADGNSYDFNLEMEVKGPSYKQMTAIDYNCWTTPNLLFPNLWTKESRVENEHACMHTTQAHL